MPVIVESIKTPTAADHADLIKIYNDAPKWLTTEAIAEEWLSRTLADAQLHLYAARFNDRLLAAAIISPTVSETKIAWELEWLNVRKITRNRGVGQRLTGELQRLAKKCGASLVVRRSTESPLPSYLNMLRA